MPGFSNGVVYGVNVNFNDQKTATVTTDGQLLIGATAAPNIRVGTLTSTGGTLTITNGAGTINLEAGATTPTTFSGDSGSATPAANILRILGSSTSAGTNPLISSASGNTVTLIAQRSQAIASADATKVGLSNFSSANFSVAATGFVTLSTTGAVVTLSGDTGTATPIANNIQIAGGPGITTSATGAVVTVNSVVFTDTTAATLAVDNGYFATAAGTYALPATAVQGEIIIIVADTAGAVVVDAPALNFIRIGSAITSSGGTATSTAIGDSLTLRYRLSSLTWEAVSVVGNWSVV